MSALLTLLLLQPAAAPNPPPAPLSDDVTRAADYLRKIPYFEKKYYRFFSLHAVPAEERVEFLYGFAYTVNSLSDKKKLKLPKLISTTLLVVDIRDYGWDSKEKLELFEKLAAVEPYYHLKVKITEVVKKPVKAPVRPAKALSPARTARPPSSAKNATRNVLAPWLPKEDITYLATHTKSNMPVARADWFFTQVAIQKGRVAGYYAWFNLKKRDDFFKLVGFDPKQKRVINSEIGFIVQKSGISIRNRAVSRWDATGAGYWMTKDVVNKQTGNNNAVFNLNGDYKHDAEEHYGFLPNGLFAYYLSDADGTQQDTAPDEVGPDTSSSTNDKKIHPFLSCTRCHKEGLRPIDDYARKHFRGKVRLQDVNKKTFLRLEQLYLSPYKEDMDTDIARFARSLRYLNGAKWTIKKNSDVIGDIWYNWAEKDVTLRQAAKELGVTPALLQSSLRAHAKKTKAFGVNHVLGAFLHDEPLEILREHWEEFYQEAVFIVKGLTPVIVEKK